MPFSCRSALGWAGVILLVCPSARAQQANPNQTQPSAPTSGGLQAGGLAPPSPIAAGPTATQTGNVSPTEAQLRKAQTEDTGRGLQWFHVQAEGGLQALGLQTFKSSGLTYGSVRSTGFGPMYGIGLGVRALVFTAGARFRTGNFADYKVNTLNGEFGLRIPMGKVEPYVSLGGGYAFLSALDTDRWQSADIAVRGFDVRAGLGLDYFITSVFSVGASLTGEMLGLHRTAAHPSTPSQPNAADVAAKGSGIGSAMTVAGVLGLHF